MSCVLRSGGPGRPDPQGPPQGLPLQGPPKVPPQVRRRSAATWSAAGSAAGSCERTPVDIALRCHNSAQSSPFESKLGCPRASGRCPRRWDRLWHRPSRTHVTRLHIGHLDNVLGQKWTSRSSAITQLNRGRSSQSLDNQEPQGGARDDGTIHLLKRIRRGGRRARYMSWTSRWTHLDTSVNRPYLTLTEAGSDALWSSVTTGPRRFISPTAWPIHTHC